MELRVVGNLGLLPERAAPLSPRITEPYPNHRIARRDRRRAV